jgi:hypothetical protein
MSDDRVDEAVGYGRPPKQHRFKKGQSGNPKGRPRVQKSFLALVADALDERVVVQEAGQRKMIKKFEAAAKQFANKVASGDYRALKLLLELTASPQWKEATPDQRCVSDPVARIRKRLEEMRANLEASNAMEAAGSGVREGPRSQAPFTSV